MELRDSGRGLVQIKDGTHAILPVTSGTNVQPDHARVPVMLLRHSDGKMRRDGSNAASMQPSTAVAERGRLHGASGLAVVEEPRVLAYIREPCRNQERNGKWVRWRRMLGRLRRQDKSRKVRPVDRLGFASNFKQTSNVKQTRQNLASLSSCCSCAAFDTLWQT